MSKETTATAELPNETASYQNADWRKVTACVGIAIIVALGVHYVVFAGMNLSPTVHALIGMISFFIAGFVTFGVLY